MGLAILDLQHVGKPSAPTDLGAGADLDGDGLQEVHEREAMLTPGYIAAATRELARRGHRCIVLARGEYSARHMEAATAARELVGVGSAAYVACHLNAGGGRYGSVFHDSRSAAGMALAEHVATQMRAALPELASVNVRPAARTGSWIRAYSTIDGIFSGPAHLVGLCFEPAFMDTEAHRPLLGDAGLDRIGRSLGFGLDRWFRSRDA